MTLGRLESVEEIAVRTPEGGAALMYSVEIRVMNDQGEQEGDLLSLIFDTLEEASKTARTAFETEAEKENQTKTA
jgi:hypothetical protein